jgi:hypothetical protein
MEPYSYMKPNNTVKIHVVNQCRRSVLASRKNIVAPCELGSLRFCPSDSPSSQPMTLEWMSC